jgi:hypothetical protein
MQVNNNTATARTLTEWLQSHSKLHSESVTVDDTTYSRYGRAVVIRQPQSVQLTKFPSVYAARKVAFAAKELAMSVQDATDPLIHTDYVIAANAAHAEEVAMWFMYVWCCSERNLRPHAMLQWQREGQPMLPVGTETQLLSGKRGDR